MDYSVIINDHTSTDAEGEPNTTISVPPVASEKTNGENTQKNKNHGADNAEVYVSPALEEHDELQEEELTDSVRKQPVPCELCSR